MAYTKVSEKLYQIQIDGKYVDIPVVYGKAQKLFELFLAQGGVIDAETGEVKNDIMALVSQFGLVGDCLLSQYGPKGQLIEEGDCSQLSVAETICLFQMAAEIVADFINVISATRSPTAPEVAEVKEPRAKKTKD